MIFRRQSGAFSDEILSGERDLFLGGDLSKEATPTQKKGDEIDDFLRWW